MKADFTFKQTIKATPAEAFRMFTHATALRDWFANTAQVDARSGGVIVLGWSSGHYVCAEIRKFAPGQKLVLVWDGKGEPMPTTVTVTFRAKGPDTVVTVRQAGVGSGARWAATRRGIQEGWPSGLENLKSVLETGIDLRVARRPRLGIMTDDFDAAAAQKLGVPVKRGILISGTAEGTGARAIGWEKGDVLVKMGGKPAVDWPTLQAALQGRQAGDKVPVTWYRGSQKMTGTLQLGNFPFSSVPATAAELAAAVRQRFDEVNAGLADLLTGVTESEANAHPGAEWSVNELIGHFILCERDQQSWAADMLNDVPVEDGLEARPNVAERIKPLVQRFQTTGALMAELHSAQAETVVLLESLPPTFVARRHLYRLLALWMLEWMPSHFQEQHTEQFRTALAAAKGMA